MSLQDISSPPIEPWSNFYINSINANSITAGTINGNPIIHNIEGPLTISANVPSGQFIFRVITENNGANNTNVALAASNFDSSAVVTLNTTNQPSPHNSLVALVGDLLFTTFGGVGANHIQFYPGVTLALDMKTTGPGQTLTSIQNTQLYGNSTAGYIPSTLNYYEEANIVLGFNGPWGATVYNRNCAFTRIGRMVTLKIDAIVQTVTTTGVNIFTLTPIPARFLPSFSADSVNIDFIINVVTGGFTNGPSLGLLRIDNTGLIGIFPANVSTTISNPLPQTFNLSVYYPATIGFKDLSVGGFENLSISYSV